MSARWRRCSISSSAVIETLIRQQFKGKDKLIAANQGALGIGYDEAEVALRLSFGVRVRRSDAVGDRVFIDGNAAAGSAPSMAGRRSAPGIRSRHPRRWPKRSTLLRALSGRSRDGQQALRDRPGRRRDRVDWHVIGAGWNGARAFTATSGPGISLMQEFLGLAYFAEIPAVLFDVQRGGP